jgi:hypothetical protein
MTKELLTKGDSAKAYASGGWPIIPLHTREGAGECSCGKPGCKVGKHPRIKAWEVASCDPATVEGWWKLWPDANIGLRLDGLIVFDMDGAEGLESLAALEAEYGTLAPCARQRSGSGGWHYLFEAVPGIEKRIKFRPGLDLLTGPGSYIVCAPSLHASGKRYEWTDETNPLSQHRDHIRVE